MRVHAILVHVLHVPGADPYRDGVVAALSEQSEVCLHLDRARDGCMSTWLSAISCATHDAQPWSAILADDADPFPGWQADLEAACEHSPEPFLGLTYEGHWGQYAAKAGVPYGVGPHLLWGGAVAYQRDQVEGLSSWAHQAVPVTRFADDDWLTAGYAKRIGVQTAMTGRAIFDQRAPTSLIAGHFPTGPPEMTIRDPGPAWDAVPASVEVPRLMPNHVIELARWSPTVP